MFGCIVLAIFCVLVLVPAAGFGQSDLPTRVGVGFSFSTLGLGMQAATPVTGRSNVRGGFNFFNYSRSFAKDGANYSAELNLRSISLQYDQFLARGFHVSPGVLLWNGNKGTATVSVPGGQSFSLGSTTYYSDRNSPANGTGLLSFRKTAPMLLAGYGNLASKGQGHFAFVVDAGVVFQGSPAVALNLAGNVCLNSNGTNCQNIATTPAVQNNVVAEQNKVNSDLSPFKYYPVIQLTFGYKFK